MTVKYAIIDSSNIVRNIFINPPEGFQVPPGYTAVLIHQVGVRVGWIYHPDTDTFTPPD